MNRFIAFLMAFLVMVACSCTHHEPPKQEVVTGLWWGISIRTTIAQQDTIGDEIGICIPNDALNYTLDTATAQELTKNRYAIRDLSGDEPAVWVLNGQEFTHIPIHCGGSDGKRTIITDGLEGGESVVSTINISPQK